MSKINSYSLVQLDAKEISEINGGSGFGHDLGWFCGMVVRSCIAFADGAADQRGMLPH